MGRNQDTVRNDVLEVGQVVQMDPVDLDPRVGLSRNNLLSFLYKTRKFNLLCHLVN